MRPTPQAKSDTPEINPELDLSTFAQAAPVPLQPEDLTAFAIDQDFNETAAKKVLTVVPVKKPSKEAFVRTSTDPAHWQQFAILELKELGKTYLLTPGVAAALRDDSESTLQRANLVLSVDKRGNPFLWPLKVSERESEWNLSARRGAEIAKGQWARITANMNAQAYDTMVASNQASDPAWPSESYSEILSLAFKGRVIDTLDHPAIQELRGN
jgi:hypothetical protein